MFKKKSYYILVCLAVFFLILFIYVIGYLHKYQKENIVLQKNYTDFLFYEQQIPLLAKEKQKQGGGALFSRITNEAEKLNLATKLEALTPSESMLANVIEQVDIQFSGLYLEECMELIDHIEKYEDLKIEKCSIQLDDKKTFILAMSVVRYGSNE